MRAEYIPDDRLIRILRSLKRVDRLIADVCLATGARIDDVLSLRKWQIDTKVTGHEQICVAESKTDKIRIVPITMDLADRLTQQCKGRHHLSYVFPGQLRPGQRRKINRSTFWRHFVESAKACGYKDCTYTPHSLRKIYAVRKLQQTRSLEAVRRDLGHKHLTTTMLYALSDRQDDFGLY